MAMKTSDQPRRVYRRNDVLHVLFEGKQYGPKDSDESEIETVRPVVCTLLPSNGGRARITVTQKCQGRKPVSETWTSIVVPLNPREVPLGDE